MKKYLGRIWNRLHLCKKILFRPMSDVCLELNFELRAKTDIAECLKKNVTGYNQPEFQVQGLVDEIYAIANPNKPSHKYGESITATLPAFTAQQLYIFTQVCAIAAAWELNLRLMAKCFGIGMYEELNNHKGKKSPKKEAKLRSAEQVIKDVKKRVMELRYPLTHLLNLRNELVHCNFYKLKQLYTASKKDKKAYQSDLVILKYDDINSTPKFAHELTNPETEDYFTWVMDASHLKTEMFYELFKMFDESCRDLNAISLFKSLSYGELSFLVDKVLVERSRLDTSEVERLETQARASGQRILEVLMNRIYPAIGI